MNNLQSQQLIVRRIDGNTEEQARVSLVHNLLISIFQEGAHLGFPAQYQGYQFPGGTTFLLLRDGVVPLLEAEFTLPAE